MQFVIIGGGIAGTTCAQELRKLNASAEITIIEQEPHRLYSKVMLARYITGELERERLFLKTDNWYRENNIELMVQTIVESIDKVNKYVKTSDGREVPYDKLLIASGQEPKLVDDNQSGIAYLRTLDDAEYFKSLLGKLGTAPAEDRRVIVVGGSFISMEFLHICKKLDIKASVILRSSGFWSRMLSKESQEMIAKEARELGVDVYANTGFSLLESDEFCGVRLDDGAEIRGKVLAVAIGLESDLVWVSGSEIKVDKGILCDSYLMTSSLDVFCAGDIAQFDDIISGRQRQVVNWTNAIEQGITCAHNMNGEKLEYKFVSSYASRIGNLEITFIGDTSLEGAQSLSRIVKDNAVLELFVRNNKTVGAVILGSAKERQAITKAITEQKLYNN